MDDFVPHLPLENVPRLRVVRAIGIGLALAILVIAASFVTIERVYDAGWNDHAAAVKSGAQSMDASWTCHGDLDECTQDLPEELQTQTTPSPLPSLPQDVQKNPLQFI